ncbi:4-(cytidine 5'-diphospho)-2-C-methyl-D-erythritol kinase [Candidatus Zixiibacteriota bacterium]
MAAVDNLVLHSAAKINLNLAVLRRMPDGYHEIFTTFQAIDLFDTLTFEKTTDGGIRIICDNPEFPTDRENLIYQVLERAEKYAIGAVNVRITVNKQIPIAAGLGGGSSNAAATIVAANLMYNLGLSDSQMTDWARELGADVPFFLGNAQAEGRGRGDLTKQIQVFGDYWVLLIKPPGTLSAGEVYQGFDLALTKQKDALSFNNCRGENDFFARITRAENILTTVVVRLCPEVGRVLEFLEELKPVTAKVSGSGPCVFGIFKKRPNLLDIGRSLPSADWRVFDCRPLVDRVAIGLGSQTTDSIDRQGADRGNH